MVNQNKKHTKLKSTGVKKVSNINQNSAPTSNMSVELIDEEPNSGFSNYLKSDQGVEIMRLFVIANSLLAVITFAWPSIKDTFEIIRDFISASNTQNLLDF